jgi:tRNA threonylcarbamoyladenosine biosynthesis protein TsaB
MSGTWLVLETSGRLGRVGLARGGAIVRSRELAETRRLARDLAPLTGELLRQDGLAPREVAGVMVSIGPGSYTGLRVGIMSAKAFAYATGIPLIAVPTFAAIALQVPAEVETWVIADGLQGLVYVQRFRAGAALDELRIAKAEDVLPAIPAGSVVTGPGVAVYEKSIPPGVRIVDEPDREPTLMSVFRAGSVLAPHSRELLFALEPLYLRGSSAEEKAKASAE